MASGPRKRITARFYQTEAGNRPVRDWILGLGEDDRRIVGKDIATVEFGWPVGMPLSRPIGDKGLREVRSTIRDGKVEARVIFGIDGNQMVLLHGHQKKPSQQHVAVKVAERRWADYRKRKARREG
jgi:phage-related protein